jgi:hypothetical protein
VVSAVEVFDDAGRWRPSIARRYRFLVDVDAEVAAVCWELIRAGEHDQGRLYWRTRRKVATLAARHGRERCEAIDPVLLQSHPDGAVCAVEALVERVAAAQMVATVPAPPADVLLLTSGCPSLSAAGRARGRRWLRRYRRVMQARSA